MRRLLNNVRELNNEDNYLVGKIHLLRFLFVVVVLRSSLEENCLLPMNRSNLKKSNMEELLKRIVDTGIQNLISDRRLYVPPPTRKERRKHERELKKKFPIDFTKFIESHRT